MRAYYFPEWANEMCDEALFIPKGGMIARTGEKYDAACNPETLTSMQEFIAQNRNNLKENSLMRIVQVSVDLVRELRECVSSRNFHFSKLIAMQLVQSARGYGRKVK